MKNLILIFSQITLLLISMVSCGSSVSKKVSQFGQYQGYSEAKYDGYERRSQYLTLGKETKLAYNFYLPTTSIAQPSMGKLSEQPPQEVHLLLPITPDTLE